MSLAEPRLSPLALVRVPPTMRHSLRGYHILYDSPVILKEVLKARS